jgi:hypothetical protein
MAIRAAVRRHRLRSKCARYQDTYPATYGTRLNITYRIAQLNIYINANVEIMNRTSAWRLLLCEDLVAEPRAGILLNTLAYIAIVKH